MFKYFPLLILICAFLAGCEMPNNTANTKKIAAVDINRLLQESEPGKEAMRFLENIQTDMQNKLNVINQKLEKNPKDEAAQKELQTLYMTSQQQLQAEQQNVLTTLNTIMQRVMDSIRSTKGYDIILNMHPEITISVSPDINITNEILTELNKQKVEFTPLPAPTVPTQEPEAEKKAPEETKQDKKDKKK